jgi:hypothetical protein
MTDPNCQLTGNKPCANTFPGATVKTAKVAPLSKALLRRAINPQIRLANVSHSMQQQTAK